MRSRQRDSPSPRGTVDRSRVKHLEQHELDTAHRLADNLGYDVTFRPVGATANADALLRGSHPAHLFQGEQIWEFKSPKGAGPQTIRDLLRKSDQKRQSRRVIIDLARTDLDRSEVERQIAAYFSRYQYVTKAWILLKDEQTVVVVDRPEGNDE